MAALKFVETHNLAAFLEKSADSEEFDQIIDFLNASSIRYALTINPTIFISRIDQFWSTYVVKKNNGQAEIHALIDEKKIVEPERMGYEKLTTKLTFYKAFFSPQWKFLIHTILQCLSAKMTVWNEFSSIVASAIICLATNQKFNFLKFIMDGMLRNLEDKAAKFLMYPRFVQLLVNQLDGLFTHHRKYVVPYHTKKIFANMKRANKEFSSNITPLFPTMVVQAQAPPVTIIPTPTPTPTHASTIATTSTQPSQQQKQRVKRPARRETEPTVVVDVPTSSSDPLSGEDRLKLAELINICTQLSSRVLTLENTKAAQAKEIAMLKKRVKRLEKGKQLSSSKLKRLFKVGTTTRVQSLDDDDTVLGDQVDASKQGRSIEDINEDAGITLDNTTFTNTNLFGVHDMGGEEVFADKTVEEEMTLAQTLMDIKTKAKGIILQKPSDSVLLEEEARIQKEKEEEASNAALVAEWDEIQARIDTDYELA
ncbi:hypothetical protein Tco_1223436 [Tanacetum coccineum]